ncbi:lysophospholipid acyltransferase family protein [Streptomyces meridianus]|uniref:1-acyl-sn-glycerol-3-phosphate acyltransferase n=1 Tax=Streptomyces meridianus TaxID=2938945 RepID=A0ABT0XAX5_9ACTN|nr:lysophospholipid acyltransferase family protein [Streptomyces meridianus]MCM2579651.1 1-acyl-sn-glycerol-3-phosphate acyltransferase [Streptomyces meridianus]
MAASEPQAGVVRRHARLAVAGLLLTAGILLAPLVRRWPPDRCLRVTAAWSRALAVSFGLRVRVSGCPGPVAGRPALVVANHISWLDVALVAAVRPGRVVAKSDIAFWPVLGRIAALGGTLFLERERLRALPGAVAEMTRTLGRGTSVVVFPEGSTWCGRRQGPFRPAAFQAAIDAAVPVQPVLIRYRSADGRPAAAASYVGEDTLVASLRRVVAARGLIAEVRVLPLIPPGAHPDRRALARAAHAAVTAARGEREGTERAEAAVPRNADVLPVT